MLIFEFEKLGSTQDAAFELVEQGERPPFVVTTLEMTEGRGRRGREWVFEKGKSLAFSLAVRTQLGTLTGLSLGVGVALTRVLADLPLQLKWPNDLMLEDQKVGGILIETRVSGSSVETVIGVGLNLKDLGNGQYRGLNVSQVSLSEIASEILKVVRELETGGFQALREEYETKLWRKGKRVSLLTTETPQEVEILGVDELGRLISFDGSKYELASHGEILWQT